MVDRGTVVWAPDPFKTDGNPRPWVVVSSDRLPYADEESISVSLSTQSHHPGSIPIPGDAWIRGEPRQQSHVLPWTLATLKDELHIVGMQGDLTSKFVEHVVAETVSYLQS